MGRFGQHCTIMSMIHLLMSQGKNLICINKTLVMCKVQFLTYNVLDCVLIITYFILKLYRSTASWPLEVKGEEKQGWRHIRIHQMGKNASGQTHYLSLSGFEIYGHVNGVCDDLGKTIFWALFRYEINSHEHILNIEDEPTVLNDRSICRIQVKQRRKLRPI